MSRCHVIFLGGGLGGLYAAKRLDAEMAANPELAAALDVVVLERGSVVHVGATNQMAFMNIIRPEEAAVPLSKLKFKHARLVHDEVLSVDTAARVVTTRSGRFPYDRLVVALGATLHPELVPGLSAAAYSFCSLHEVLQLKSALERFEGGSIVVLQPALPVKCPPLPYEIALLINGMLRAAKPDVHARTKITVVTPDPTPVPLPNPGPLTEILKRKGVEFRGKCVAKAVDLAAKSVELASGEKVAFDLLVSHALHRAPQLLADCKLANETGFVPANVHTLRTAVPGVYAIGDCAALKMPHNPAMGFPKAGALAMHQAAVVAADIAKHWRQDLAAWTQDAGVRQGDLPQIFNECPIDVGDGESVVIRLDVFTDKPSFTVSAPKRDDGQEKLKWWRGVLAAIFD